RGLAGGGACAPGTLALGRAAAGLAAEAGRVLSVAARRRDGGSTGWNDARTVREGGGFARAAALGDRAGWTGVDAAGGAGVRAGRERGGAAHRRESAGGAGHAVRIDIVTLFPGMLEAPLGESIVGRARARGLVDVRLVNLRDHATGGHLITTDAAPCGGGGGMILKPEPLAAALEAARREGAHVILLDPAGRRFTQTVARDLAPPATARRAARPCRGGGGP